MKKVLFVLFAACMILVGCTKPEPQMVYVGKNNGKGKNDRIAPTVEILTPSNGDTLPMNTPYTIKVNATDNVGIVEVGIIANYPNPFGPEIIPSNQAMFFAPPYEATFVTPNQPCNLVLIVFAADKVQMTQKNIYLKVM